MRHLLDESLASLERTIAEDYARPLCRAIGSWYHQNYMYMSPEQRYLYLHDLKHVLLDSSILKLSNHALSRRASSDLRAHHVALLAFLFPQRVIKKQKAYLACWNREYGSKIPLPPQVREVKVYMIRQNALAAQRQAYRMSGSVDEPEASQSSASRGRKRHERRGKALRNNPCWGQQSVIKTEELSSSSQSDALDTEAENSPMGETPLENLYIAAQPAIAPILQQEGLPLCADISIKISDDEDDNDYDMPNSVPVGISDDELRRMALQPPMSYNQFRRVMIWNDCALIVTIHRVLSAAKMATKGLLLPPAEGGRGLSYEEVSDMIFQEETCYNRMRRVMRQGACACDVTPHSVQSKYDFDAQGLLSPSAEDDI
ncbi:hypothetical protein NLU13_0074 [Sarocladium strictum]|uniref:Uncharacterized protein n=1 Tax=Sarocladium strictum TaxID=5046 RepID=A0AA39GNE0_SARSR|nr:hypothetical protein NLU13_0074 [Sarocladium strictum]